VQRAKALVESIRARVAQLQSFVLKTAGGDAQDLPRRIEALNVQFKEARGADDSELMHTVALERREAWHRLSQQLKPTRIGLKQEIGDRFLRRIGKNVGCDTYQLRCEAVANRLGWATANAVLDAALVAFKKSFALGRAPRFAVGHEKMQDSLTLQFTNAGGVAAESILSGRHRELRPPDSRRTADQQLTEWPSRDSVV
jgi:hypothetical protein